MLGPSFAVGIPGPHVPRHGLLHKLNPAVWVPPVSAAVIRTRVLSQSLLPRFTMWPSVPTYRLLEWYLYYRRWGCPQRYISVQNFFVGIIYVRSFPLSEGERGFDW